MALVTVSAMILLMTGHSCLHVTPKTSNGIKDFYFYDLFTETGEDTSDDQEYDNNIHQKSLTDSNKKDADYSLKSMPEYHMDTKADFEGNQEAIDWLIKDPNEFNVKSFVDSDEMDDGNSLKDLSHMHEEDDSDGAGNDGHSLLNRHSNHWGNINHGMSTVDTNTQRVNQASESLSNEMKIENDKENRNRETWRDQVDNADPDDFPGIENMKKNKKSWENTGEDLYDGLYHETHIQNGLKKSSSATTLNNLNSRIRNQDAKLMDEVESFQNTDNSLNYDDSDILGDLDEQSDQGDYSKEETLHSNKQKAEYSDDESEGELERGNDSYQDYSKISNSNPGKNNHQYDEDRGSQKFINEYPHTSATKFDKDNGRVGKTNSESGKDHVQSKSENDDSTDSFKDIKEFNDVEERKQDEAADKGTKESTKAINRGHKIPKVRYKGKNSHDTGRKVKSTYKHKAANEDSDYTSKSIKIQKKGDKNKEIRENEIISINNNVDIGNENRQQDREYNTKGHHEKHTALYNESTATLPSSKVTGKHQENQEEGSYNSTFSQDHQITSKSKHGNQNISSDVIVDNGKRETGVEDDIKTKVSEQKYNGEVAIVEQAFLPPESNDSDEQSMLYKKLKEIDSKLKRISQKKLRALSERPPVDAGMNAQLPRGKKNSNVSYGNASTATGVRRDQANYAPSTSIYSSDDLLRLQRIVSYLRGTAITRSSPTKAARFSPANLSLKSLYYYPMHPTPQEESISITGTKDSTFSEWNDWSTCSVSCGKGITVRGRVCLVSKCSENDLFQTKRCNQRICADDLKKESLQEHNKFRRKHLSPPLQWSNALARKAQQIADTLATKDFLTIDDLQEQQGESFAQIKHTKEHLAKKAIDKWYSEINSYSFSYPQITGKTRHFVQIVWKGTKEMGFAIAKNPTGDYAFVVALYAPSIDSKKHLGQNVLRPGVQNDLYSTFKRRHADEFL
ncbi:myb-like protein F isoform X1 [Montipora foliosa]|uniref:myb-like protein F isoform X1 n=1 Tax=Montipora foliosa TaxID=591990 RepID=UPI0035F18F85